MATASPQHHILRWFGYYSTTYGGFYFTLLLISLQPDAVRPGLVWRLTLQPDAVRPGLVWRLT